MTQNKQLSNGFTIIEMLIIAPIVLLAIGAFITAIVSMTGDVLASRSSNALAYSIQDTLSRIESDVKMSTSFLSINKIELESSSIDKTYLTSPQGYDNNDSSSFTNIGTNGNMLILNALVTTGNPLDANSSLVYLANKPNACTSSSVADNTPMSINIIYFVKDNTLWRRTVMPFNYATGGVACNSTWQQPSCNPDYMKDNPSSSAFCKTQDEKLIEGIDPEDIDFQYFNSASSSAADGVATTSTSTDTRYAALQSLSTLVASINISKTAAGRDISQSGSIRATRLDVNASSIAEVTPDIEPIAPVATGSIDSSAPTTVNFTWPTSLGASGYTLDFRVDARNPVALTNPTGTWTRAFTNQNLTTFSKTVKHGDIVNVRLVAVNSIGQTSASFGETTTVTVPVWSTLKLINNWTDYGGFSTAAFTKTDSGMILIKGLVRSGSTTSGLPLNAQLPEGYRPNSRLLLMNSSGGARGRVDVNTAGEVLFLIGGNSWFSLDGIAFMPSGTTFTGLTPLLNSWVNHSTTYSQAEYMTDSAGRVQVQGLVANGVATSGTAIDTLPAGSRPSQYLHMPNISTDAAGHISIDSSGNILAKGYSNAFIGLHSAFFPASRVDGTNCTTQWCTPTLLNGWKHYGSIYATPRYTKASDGVVHLKGLINGGAVTSGSDIMSLPAGYCPKQRTMLTSVANTTWSRIDVLAGTGSGCTVVTGQENSTSTTWTSLDNLKWLAEW